MELGAEPAADVSVRKLLWSRACYCFWEPTPSPSMFLKYVTAAQAGVLPITLLKADLEIDRVS